MNRTVYCPKCDEGHLEDLQMFDVDGDCAIRTITCGFCGWERKDIYVLHHHEDEDGFKISECGEVL